MAYIVSGQHNIHPGEHEYWLALFPARPHVCAREWGLVLTSWLSSHGCSRIYRQLMVAWYSGSSALRALHWHLNSGVLGQLPVSGCWLLISSKISAEFHDILMTRNADMTLQIVILSRLIRVVSMHTILGHWLVKYVNTFVNIHIFYVNYAQDISLTITSCSTCSWLHQ